MEKEEKPPLQYDYTDCLDGKIYELIPKIMAEIGAVGKNQVNQQQKFKFRGIDDIYNAVHSKLSSYGVFTIPRIIKRERSTFKSKHGTDGFHIITQFKFKFVANDGSYFYADADGEAMDYGDKASNKAAAIAHKYALLQVFCIPTADLEDPDKEAHTMASGTRVAQKTPVKPLDLKDPNWLIKFGTFSGKKISQVDQNDLMQYCEALEKDYEEKKKEVPAIVKELISRLEAIYGL